MQKTNKITNEGKDITARFIPLTQEMISKKKSFFVAASPHEIYERKVTQDEIYIAINQLSGKQAKRIFAHFFQDIPMLQIAKMEGVDESAIRRAISRGLAQIEKILKNL